MFLNFIGISFRECCLVAQSSASTSSKWAPFMKPFSPGNRKIYKKRDLASRVGVPRCGLLLGQKLLCLQW